MKFYKCEHCGNIVTFVEDKGVPVMCCGQKMTELNANTTDAAELEFTAVKGSTTIIDKMDITTTKTNVQIPTTVGGTDYTHKLVADAGATVSDSWTLTVTLKNLGVDQNDNTGKNFAGAVKFDKTNCK